jgi:hypothetical protein
VKPAPSVARAFGIPEQQELSELALDDVQPFVDRTVVSVILERLGRRVFAERG